MVTTFNLSLSKNSLRASGVIKKRKFFVFSSTYYIFLVDYHYKHGRPAHTAAGYNKYGMTLKLNFILYRIESHKIKHYFSFLQQAEHFCNSIGILQQFSTPSKFLGFDRIGSQTPQQQQNQEDYAVLFATLISRCAKDIDTLIESLPSEESSTELQVQSLRRLEAENKEAAEKLEEVTFYLNYRTSWITCQRFYNVIIFNPSVL